MKKKILCFYNKNTNKVIGYHHPTKFVVDNVINAYIYKNEVEVIDVDSFINMFVGNTLMKMGLINTNSTIYKINNKYFNGLNEKEIGHKYVDYHMEIRKSKINKIKVKL